jgi:formate hydrogenlyase subunit 3/multisubunit Na+/H+ antiporter MnhD subunit
MLASSIDQGMLAWTGALILLFGELIALSAMRSLPALIVISTIAETGYFLMGLGVGGDAGNTGAWMHLGYQAVMRGMLIVAAWWLVRRTGDSSVAALRGSGKRMPVAATLFGLAMFSVMGLSPFKGAYSKFIVLYSAIEQGAWGLAVVGTVASIVAAIYSIIVIQRICFEQPDKEVELAPAPLWLTPALALLTGATIVMSLWPAPFLHAAELFAGALNPAAIPEFESPWTTLVLVPYVGGFVVYAIGRLSAVARDMAAIALAVVTVALTMLEPGLDPASRLFALIFAVIAFAVVLYSRGYMAHAAHANRYYFFVFLMVGSLLGVATTTEFGNFYLFWELMTWTSYLLVIHDQTEKALKAGFVYFTMCAGGAYVMHLGILLMHAQVGSFDFSLIAANMDKVAPLTGAVAALCLFTGFAVKAGFFPFHAWLPLAHPEAPSSISAPLSGILTKAGLFGMVKVLYVVFGAAALARFAASGVDLGAILMVLGAATLIYGEIQALFQKELKRMLAYSTLAQIGEIGLILGLGTALATSAAMLHIGNHAVMKTLLFFGAGAFILRGGYKQIEHLAGLGRVMPFTAGCYAVATLAIMGLPPFSGFISKFLMIDAAVAAGRPDVAALILVGSVIAAFYYLRVVRFLFFYPYAGTAKGEAPRTMMAAIGLLAVAIVAGGLMPGVQIEWARAVGEQFATRGALPLPELPDLTLIWPASALIAALGAVVVYVTGRKSDRAAGAVAVVTLLTAAVAVVAQADQYDGLSYAFALLIAVVGAGNLLYSTGYMAHSHAKARFYAAFTLVIGGLLGMCASHDLFNFFAFWEVMSSWALYFALIHEETEEARREGLKYFMFNTAGAGFLFLGVVMLGTAAGSFEFTAISAAAPTLPLPWFGAAVVLVFIGMLMKAAMLPVRIDYQMHPAEAPTPISGYISAVLLKSGPYGVIKMFALLGGATVLGRLGTTFEMPTVMYAVAVIATLTILYTGAMAMIQTGIKRLLIYSTVCQLGYVTLGLALTTSLGVAGGLMHFVNHMLLKDLLFLTAGCVMVASHATTLDELGGMGKRMPITFAIFLFAGLSLAGIPPLNGFGSKWLIYVAAFESGHYVMGVVAMIGSLLTLAAILKFAHAAFMGAPSAQSEHAHEAPLSMLIPMGLMVAGCLAIGLMPGLLLMPIAAIQSGLGIEPVAASLFVLPAAGGWAPALLMILVVVTFAVVRLYANLGTQGALVRSPIHRCGVELPAAATHVNATNLFESPAALVRAVFRVKNGHPKKG